MIGILIILFGFVVNINYIHNYFTEFIQKSLVNIAIVYIWWNTPIFVFPFAEHSYYKDLYETQFVEFSFIEGIFLKYLSLPSMPLGVVGIIPWTVACRAVVSLIL